MTDILNQVRPESIFIYYNIQLSHILLYYSIRYSLY
jgi:hypothetical protein